jgi:hypothetical protein
MAAAACSRRSSRHQRAPFQQVGDADAPEVMRFPPGIGKWQLEQSGYLKSSPQLVGTIHSFGGNDADHRAMLETLDKGGDWTAGQRTTQVSLAPAACYGVYPAVGARGRMGENGALVDCYTYCFRHEPSVDPARMQMFRQREHVRLGSEQQALAFRETWKERGQAIIGSFGLPFEVDIANDPFFGRTGRLLATSQREESLKFELLVPIHAPEHPTACCSFNYHRDLFGRAWGIETAAGRRPTRLRRLRRRAHHARPVQASRLRRRQVAREGARCPRALTRPTSWG